MNVNIWLIMFIFTILAFISPIGLHFKNLYLIFLSVIGLLIIEILILTKKLESE